MTKQPGIFWSGETLGERLKMLIDPFAPGRVWSFAWAVLLPSTH